MRRRKFLSLTLVGAPAVLLAGCDDKPVAREVVETPALAGTPPTATTPATSRPSAAASPAPSATRLAEPLRQPQLQEYPVVRGSGPHDVACAPDGRSVWYTGQRNGTLGRLFPATGVIEETPLGAGSAPHGVIVGPDGAAWVTDGGRDEITRVGPAAGEVVHHPLPGKPGANLNTAAFDGRGNLWFTGQSGYYGRVDPKTAKVDLYRSPRGSGPYGITGTPSGDVYYASLAGSHIAKVNLDSGEAAPIDPPTARQGARRVWSDSGGRIWLSEWNAGQVAVYDPAGGTWKEWKLPGEHPQAYAVYVDERDSVWLTDFGANTIVRFDPATERFTSVALPKANASVRQLLGRPGEVWGAESSADALVVVHS